MASSPLRNSSGDPEPSKDNGTVPEDTGSKPADNGANMEDNGTNIGQVRNQRGPDNASALDNKTMNTGTHVVDVTDIAKVDEKVDMPGLRVEGAKVEIGEDGWLSISGQRKEEEVEPETVKADRVHLSTWKGMNRRTFNLPPDRVDMDKMKAQVDWQNRGLLTVIVANDETRKELDENLQANRGVQTVPPMPRSKLKWKETAAEHIFIADLPEDVDMENVKSSGTSEQLTLIIPKRVERPPSWADTSMHGSSQLQSNTEGAEKTHCSASGS